MAHLNVLVLFESSDSEDDKLLKQADKILSRYDLNESESISKEIDNWEAFVVVRPQDWDDLLFGSREHKVVGAVVMPDGKWIHGPYIYIGPNQSKQDIEQLNQWKQQVEGLLESHSQAKAVLADVHV